LVITAGLLIGGIFSVFPAATIVAFGVIHRSRGPAPAQALARPFMINALVNVMTYVLAVRYMYPVVGLALGTLLTYLITGATAYSPGVLVEVRSA
jgi:hypothetical protein